MIFAVGAIVFIALNAALITAIVLKLYSVRRGVVKGLGGTSKIALLDAVANLRAVESKGVVQIAGNGCLAMNAEEILFVMWWPRREVRISRKNIVAVTTPATFMGKRSGRPMLHIRWKAADGATDSAAWLVRNRDAWVRALS